jgi:hypothetical protein
VTAHQRAADSFIRRQLLLAGVAAAVVLGGIVLVTLAMAPDARLAHATLRPAPGPARVEIVSPLAESSRSATWAAAAALVAVAGVLVVLVAHTVRVARFALLPQPGRGPNPGLLAEAGAPAPPGAVSPPGRGPDRPGVPGSFFREDLPGLGSPPHWNTVRARSMSW